MTIDNPNIAATNPRFDKTMVIVEGDVGYRVVESLHITARVCGVSASTEVVTDGGTLREVAGGFADPIASARFRNCEKIAS